MMKQFAVVVVLVLVVMTVIFAFKDTLVKIAVEKAVQHVAGLKLEMSGLKIRIIDPAIEIKNLKLYNPAGYQDKVFIDMPEIYIDYDLSSFFRGEVHFFKMRINLKELVVVKNREGKLNLDVLKLVKNNGKKKAAKEKKKNTSGLKIDTLELKIGKAYYKDYSKGGAPIVKEFNVNVDETYSDIEDLTALISLIVVKTLTKTTIISMTNYEINKLKNNVKNVLTHPSKIIPVKKISEMKGTLEGVTNVFGEALTTSSEK
ncbi:MAG: AsmA family protein [Candidatus Omnitrophica bacterium]|nr:AsmA family protein [Candidatus Omnitrophota bacterium]